MSTPSHDEVRRVFSECCELQGPERDAAIDRLCAGNEALKEEVRSLLGYDDVEDALSDHAIVSGRTPGQRGGAMPEAIGSYAIIGVLGEGGSGVVYEAEQKSPRRHVALKVLRTPLLSDAMRRRFRREAQVLGRLQHPGIAQIHAAETELKSADGLPYFVMELVRGSTLTEACRAISVAQKLALFRDVCDAVQYAHEMGVVHRDLKPSNILVDEHGRAKVLDFGMARLLDTGGPPVTERTHAGQIIGTVPYMSPEQIKGDAASIGVHTDIYGLGVVLFELLTGKLPHDVRNASLPEAARRITDGEPAHIRAFDRSLSGDLDVIVATAIDREIEGRYPSVKALSEDVGRFLEGEPIRARPHSAIYHARKFAQRHRAPVVLGASLVVVLVAATVVSFIFGLGQKSAKEAAQEAEARAVVEASVRERINEFLVEDLLGAIHPLRARGEEISVRAVVDQASQEIRSGALDDQPEVAVSVNQTIGNVYRALGQYDDALWHLDASLRTALDAFEPTDARIANAWSDLGGFHLERAEFEPARDAYASAMEIYRADEKPDGIPESAILASGAIVLQRLGQYDEAEAWMIEGLALREAARAEADGDADAIDGLIANSHHNLGGLFRAQRRAAEAADHFERALEIRRRILADDSPELAMTSSMLATAYARLDRLDDASALLDEAVPVFVRAYGEGHQYVATTLTMQAGVEVRRGEHERALELYREAQQIYVDSLGEGHLYVARVRSAMASTLNDLDRFDEALESVQSAMAIERASLPEDHPNRAASRLIEGQCLLGLGRTVEALTSLEAAMRVLEVAGAESPRAVLCRIELARALRELGREDEALAAIEAARRAIQASPDTLGNEAERLAELTGG
ncbi:MAG: serine/threonine-protein kinase [Phycisphaerales bacterium]|jgi:tetratricopeptide (TPR) repeat protein/predicted Ser/Thr protein kinase